MEFGQEPPDLFIKSSTLEIRRGFEHKKRIIWKII